MLNNILIGIPSGEILNCYKECRKLLFDNRIIKYRKYHMGESIDSYIFLDKSRDDIFNTIKQKMKIGIKINHYLNGNGEINGILDNGWIIKYKNGKHQYISSDELIKDIKYKFLN